MLDLKLNYTLIPQSNYLIVQLEKFVFRYA